MNREILFKGISVDSKKWVEGCFVKAYDNDFRLVDVISFNTSDEELEFEEVDPKTVSQYTGLTDKNGARIWEGDILKIISFNPHSNNSEGETHCIIGEVVYYPSKGFSIKKHKHYEYDTGENMLTKTNKYGYIVSSKSEVIGNIHDDIGEGE